MLSTNYAKVSCLIVTVVDYYIILYYWIIIIDVRSWVKLFQLPHLHHWDVFPFGFTLLPMGFSHTVTAANFYQIEIFLIISYKSSLVPRETLGSKLEFEIKVCGFIIIWLSASWIRMLNLNLQSHSWI